MEGRQRHRQPDTESRLDRSQSCDRPVHSGIGSADGWEEEYGSGAQNRHEGELKTEMPEEYQSTVPKRRMFVQ